MTTLKKLFDLAIDLGIKNDPRNKKEIERIIAEEKKKFSKLDKKKKEFFNQERLVHPYSDSGIMFGDLDTKIKCIFAGVDMETPEILLANELRKSGKKIDAILTHHPEGRNLLDLTGVMKLQEDVFEGLGVSPNVIEKLLAPRMAEVDRALHAVNVHRSVRAAELLNIPFFGVHTPADNCVYQYFEKNICNKKYKNLGELVEKITEIPEYTHAAKQGNPPKIFVGSESSKTGKIVATEMTGGTSGAKEIYAKLENAGVGTVLSMHTGEEHRKEAEKHHINIIVCSHMASDSVGMNHICDAFEKEGVEIIPASGFIRVKRK